MNARPSHEQVRLATVPESHSNDPSSDDEVTKSPAEWLESGCTGVGALLTAGEERQVSHSAFMDEAYEEYCRLTERGEAVNLEDFCDRYPGFGTALRRQIEIHHLIVDHPSLFSECVDTAWPKPGDDILGFLLLEELGRGTFSRVFRARDAALGDRQVALKVCCSGANEARILGKLEHDNIVPIHSVHRAADTGLSLICMPYLGHATLRSVLDLVWRSGRTPRRAAEILVAAQADGAPSSECIAEKTSHRLLRRGTYVDGALFIGQKTADALAHAHRAEVLHLDLKPSNILLTASGCPKILDFNLASDLQVRTPRLGGTLPYMSPEQARCFLDGEDAANVDQRSDIYSFGVLFHELLCGTLPHGNVSQTLSSREAAEDLLTRQLNSPLSTPWRRFGVNKRLASIVERCLASDPSRRYQSAAALAADLRDELSVIGRGGRWLQARRLLVSAMAAVTVTLGVGLGAHFASRAPYPLREFQQGIACLSSHEYQASIEHLTRSLEADSSQPEALFARARASAALGDYHAAIRDLTCTLKIAENSEKLAFLGYCCNCVGSHAEAVSWYERGIDKGYESAGLYNNLGYSHYLQDRLKSALKALDQAVSIDGSRQVTLHNRAMAHYTLAINEHLPPSDGIRDIESVLALGECSGDIYVSAAKIFAYAASFDESCKAKALHWLRLALEQGVSVTTIESDAALVQLFHESQLSQTSRRSDRGVTRPPDRPRFVNPLE